MSFSPNDLYRFDEFELSPARRTLLRNGGEVALLPRTFDVLACLVQNPGRVVAKEEILKAVWRDAFVEENNLTQHISLLRKALADRARCIATIPGRGYQFTAEVKAELRQGHGMMAAAGQGTARHAEPASEGALPPSVSMTELGAEPQRKPQSRTPLLAAHLLQRMAR